MDKNYADEFLLIEEKLGVKLTSLKHDPKVTHVYNPIEYALELHKDFLSKYVTGKRKVLFLGMNPGPWGMAQTGVPFGEVNMVRDWLDIKGQVQQPAQIHPKRPIEGLNCVRREVSGERFWNLIKDLTKNHKDNFFNECAVYNHCPLAYMATSGKNVTPVEMKATFKNEIFDLCDDALADVINLLDTKIVIGIGRHAVQRAEKVIEKNHLEGIQVHFLNHPSPASASANKMGWDVIARQQLNDCGIVELIN